MSISKSMPQSNTVFWNGGYYQLDQMTSVELEDLFDQIVDVAADITDSNFQSESHLAIEAVNQELDFRNSEPEHLAWLALIYNRPTCLFPTCSNPIDPNKDALCDYHSAQVEAAWPSPSLAYFARLAKNIRNN